jgi:hypothetical protein
MWQRLQRSLPQNPIWAKRPQTANLFSLMRRNQGRTNQQFLLRACLKKADYFPKVALPSQTNPGETFKPLPDTISTPIKGTDPAGVEDRAAS